MVSRTDQNRVGVAVGQPGRCPDANSFGEELGDLDGLPLLDPKTAQRLRFGKGLAAPYAAKALHEAVFVLEVPEPFCRAGTTVTIQLAFPGRGSYITSASYKMCGWRSSPCALLCSVER